MMKQSMKLISKSKIVIVLLFFLASNSGCKDYKESNKNEWANLSNIVNSNSRLIDLKLCSLRQDQDWIKLVNLTKSDEFEALPFTVDDDSRLNLLLEAFELEKISEDTDNCIKNVETGLSLLDEEKKKTFDEYRQYASLANSEDPYVRHVQENIIDLTANDQAARKAFLAFNSNNTLAQNWAKIFAVEDMYAADKASSDYMIDLLNEINWVDKSTYGDWPSHFAWLIIQHADKNIELQELALERIYPLLESNEVSKKNYAYLVDRVKTNKGEKQIYGTQSTGQCINGLPELRPIAKPDQIDKIREEMSLKSIDEYLSQLTPSVCPN